MLKTLLIKDYALIENIEVQFEKGLNIITGETGAGKSILIDAMGLLLGERASTEVVRKGAEKSIVEGIFEVASNKKVKKFCEQNELDFADELIVRREVSLKGTNRCFLNDSPVALNLIKEAGDLLVDLHGQHEHQSLLRTETHIEMLDGFANLDAGLSEYSKNYYELLSLQREIKELLEKESALKEKRELYQFQIKEIDAVDPQIDEEEKLAQELNILENSEKLLSITSDIYSELYENENSVTDQLGAVKHKLTEIERIDKSFADSLANFDSALALLNEVSGFVRSYKDKIDLEPERLEEIRARLGAIILLKKKYGGSVNSVIEHREKIGAEFDLAENFSQRISDLQRQIDSSRKSCGAIAKELSAERISVSKKVKKEVEAALKNLGIADSQFEVRIVNEAAESGSENFIQVESKKYKFNNHGIDEVEFYISTNAGEDTKPLVKVASGGEVSRIMLALKSTLAKSDKLPILIFDEIDTGVSGRIAQKVGQTLKELASVHQIIAITHLPQIAGLADIHFAVEKRKSADRVVSSIRKLDAEKRVEEVAKLMSGEEITEAALNGARELMSISKK
ncbi:MAG: DNA repair protein RecN [Stygiobacter sp.]|nr:MAG: DNA repair protein RecN [Stygiobacter sp. RIFOXYB2_FULL_37_11]OGV09843.1 MAG: DNA repair protein RecN [Stygiobacter sp. RIFOXYA2_FULL_38_8]OGV15715.1 MAG: DNA repair protein RecN [Stygiobacter sp. RIFOXYC2_FULL_38_25]OGV80829.1 MAG: DNA repair protein RecN [Stygiobacter sp. GWF2_38_21]RJQ63588.1 MAG: DNA repair protein RecN [Stygiobacter sp.]